MGSKNYILADWGSTNIRAFLFIDGKKQEERQSKEGVTTVRGPDCQGAFDRLTQDWFDKYGPMQSIIAGMVGSVNGWVDAPYLDCPVDLNDLSSKLTPVDHPKGHQIRIIPGICMRDPDNYNVIRGEETQLAGAVRSAPSRVYLMPGTHCKWVMCNGTKVESFRTAMTGELHSILMDNSLVGAGAGEQKTSLEAFKKGLDLGFTENNIVPRLFEVRAARILGGIAPEHTKEHLSGLLMGSEIASMQKIFKFNKEDGPIVIIGTPFFIERYSLALQAAGIECSGLDGDSAFLQGIDYVAQGLL